MSSTSLIGPARSEVRKRARRARAVSFVTRLILLLILAVFIYFLVSFSQVVSTGQSAPPPFKQQAVALFIGPLTNGNLTDDEKNLIKTFGSYAGGAGFAIIAGGQEGADGMKATDLAMQYIAQIDPYARFSVITVGGTTTYSQMQEVASLCRQKGISSVAFVVDPADAYVQMAMASSLGLQANYIEPDSPTPGGFQAFGDYVKRAFELMLARPFGWRLAESVVS
jgi:uncharacterized SAM-binding protein YcdF (DUF218 family)